MRLRSCCLLALAIATALPACGRGAGDATDADATASPAATAANAASTPPASDAAGDAPSADAVANDAAAASPSAPEAPTAPSASGQWQYTGAAGDSASAHGAAIAGSDGLQLRFEDDPTWGRSAYLQGTQDVFDCAVGCEVQVAIDGGAPRTVTTSKPDNAPPRLSLREPETLWRDIQHARTVEIEFPALPEGTRGKARFEVAGVDASKLQGWN